MRLTLAVMAFLSTTPLVAAQWVNQHSGTIARLRGVCAVSDRIAWASGAGGTVLLTVDGGKTWNRRPVPVANDLDFRDVEAFSDKTAYALSIGEGSQSRIYKTTDGGATWALQLKNPDSTGFLDALAFWDADHGVVLGDPVGGRFVIFSTVDGGKTWNRTDPGGIPPARDGEGAFAASGTCLVVQGDRTAWFGTGGGRVFRSTDGGRSWTVHQAPDSRWERQLRNLLAAFLGRRSWRHRGGRLQGTRPNRKDVRSHLRQWTHLETSAWPRHHRLPLCRVPSARFARTNPDRCRPKRDRRVARRWRDVEQAERRRLPRCGHGELPGRMGRGRKRPDREV